STSDTHENIDVVDTGMLTILPREGGPRPASAPGTPAVVTVKLDVLDSSGKATWLVCMLRRRRDGKPKPMPDKKEKPPEKPHPQQHRIIGVQALRVTGRHLTATFSLAKTFPEGGTLIAHAVLLSDAGEPLGQASRAYGPLPT